MRTLLPLILALLAIGCTHKSENNAMFTDSVKDGWAYGDTLKFVAPTDTVEQPQCSAAAVAVRHGAAYRYANLWIELTGHGKDTIWVDTLNIKLIDKYGRKLGRGSGVSFIKTDTVHRQYIVSDSTPLLVRHVMRVDTLADIEQIGIVFIQ